MNAAKVSLASITSDMRSGFASGEDDPEGIVQFRMNNVDRSGSVDWTKIRRVPKRSFKPAFDLKPGDILFNSTNSPELVGKAALFRGYPEPVTFSNHFIRIRLKEDIADSGYISRYLTFKWSQRVFEGMCRQWVNQASISKDQFAELKIPLPSLEEQRTIATILDQADALRRSRSKAISLAKEFPTALFAKMFGDGRSSGNWPQSPLGSVVREGTIVTYGIVQAGEQCDGGVPYIRTGDIVDGQIVADKLRKTDPAIAAKFKRSRVDAGEIVMSIRATVGTTALVPNSVAGANLTQGTARISPGSGVEPLYLLYFLRSEATQHWITRQVKGATFREITLERLRELPVDLPPLDLQREFCAAAERIDSLQISQGLSNQSFENLFAALQQRAFDIGARISARDSVTQAAE